MDDLCLSVKPHHRGDILPPICAKPRNHDGKHRSKQFTFIMTGPTDPYDWD